MGEPAKHFIPHDYQRVAIDKIKSEPATALLLDCGLGKTAICLRTADELGFHNKPGEPFKHKSLVIGPSQVIENVWEEESEKWVEFQHLTFSKVIGDEQQRIKALNKPADFYLISRNNVVWLRNLNHPMADLSSYDFIIFDESSSFKNPEAKRTQALYDIGCIKNGYYEGPRKVILTATPMPKNLMDLYSQYRILDNGWSLPGEFGPFREQFFMQPPNVSSKLHLWVPKRGAEEAIFSRIAPITLSMKNTDLLKLPDLVMVANTVEFNESERAMYKALKHDMVIKIIDDAQGDAEKVISAVNSGVLTNKLAQLSNGFLYEKDDESEFSTAIDISNVKIRELSKILEATCENECVLVAYQFRHDLEKLIELAEHMGLSWCNVGDKDGMKKYKKGVQAAFIQPRSCGFGLNLQDKSHRLVWYALPWSYEEYEQTCSRVFRQGQEFTTFIHTIGNYRTVDEDIIAALNVKGGFNRRLKERTLAYVIEEDGSINLTHAVFDDSDAFLNTGFLFQTDNNIMPATPYVF